MSEKLILLVEDDPVQAETWELVLRQAGYQVIVAGSAEQALEAVDNRYFHVAVVDQSLKPETQGMDTLGLDIVARHLKRQIDKQMLPPVPYIIMTAYPSYEPLEKAYSDLGVSAYITKRDPEADIKLLKKIAEGFEARVRCNFDLVVEFGAGASLDSMVSGLRLKGLDLADPETQAMVKREMRDLLGKLFYDCSRVTIFTLHRGYGGSWVHIALPYRILEGMETRTPYVIVRHGESERIRREVNNYHAHGTRVNAVRRSACGEMRATKHLAGVVYSYPGMFLERAQDFDTVYLDREGELDTQIQRMRDILDDLLSVTLELWYSDLGPRHRIDFKRHYADRLFTTGDLQAHFEATFPAWKGRHLVRLPELGSQEFRTFVYDLPDLPVRPIVGYDRVITHGDLHGRNILIYEDKAWLIDFHQTGPGHIFRDFVKLESYIKFHLIETENLEALSLFEDALNSPEPSPDNRAFATREDPDDLIKAYRVILKIRGLARVEARETSWGRIREEYYAGLFYQSVATLQYSVKHARKKHALISANKIYDLLTS